MPHDQPDIRIQKRFVDSASEQGKDCNIEFASVHVIDQVDQDLFSSTQVQIMNDKKHLFFHCSSLLLALFLTFFTIRFVKYKGPISIKS